MGTAVAERAAVKLEPVPTSLYVLVTAIKNHFLDGDRAERKCIKNRLAAGKKLLELRQRVEAGEAGDVTWWDWCEAYIERSRKDCERLMRIASADDPEQALLDEREKTRLAVAKHREEKKSAELTVSSKPEGKTPKPKREPYSQPELTPRPESEIRAASIVTVLSQAWDLAEHVEGLLDGTDPADIDQEILTAAWDAYQFWGRVHRLLSEKRRSTLPQDGAKRGWPGWILSQR